jgi:hypothetical protein
MEKPEYLVYARAEPDDRWKAIQKGSLKGYYLAAAFRFMPEALDYVQYANNQGVDAILDGPRIAGKLCSRSVYPTVLMPEHWKREQPFLNKRLWEERNAATR